MNTTLIKSAPWGNFAEISVLSRGWQSAFQELVDKREAIKCDIYPLLDIPPEINNALTQQGYFDMILASDRWQHFLVPSSN